TFTRLWKQVGQNIHIYKNFPRLIGECGGKNYHFVHPTADVDTVVNGTIRSAFEYCGQKCSACSRMYVPESLWPQRIKSYIDHAKSSPNLEIIGGGKCDDSVGYFVEPTIVQTKDPLDKIMTEEIFGPVLTIYVYKDNKVQDTLDLIGNSTSFALTGAVFAQDEQFLKKAMEDLKMTAGNFYVNDKSTGSVVGQQPFGGARMSGTNDKAGAPT
ncbi:hypothetical protein NQ318_012925, partial [Aromia moschata]